MSDKFQVLIVQAEAARRAAPSPAAKTSTPPEPDTNALLERIASMRSGDEYLEQAGYAPSPPGKAKSKHKSKKNKGEKDAHGKARSKARLRLRPTRWIRLVKAVK